LFVDVGANVGIYSLWAAECGAEVIAIEPDPLAASRLRRNAQLNGYDITVIEAAVGESNGTANFTVGRDAMNAYAMDGDSVSRSVNVVTLDSVLAGRHARGVKIDVEGAERLVIVGSRAALGDRRIDYLQIEWNGMSQVLLNETREPTAELLCESGYELYRLDGQDDPNADMFARAVPRSS
jgi:FkbM family methyltransferase